MIFSFPDLSEEELFALPRQVPLIAQPGVCLLPEELLTVQLESKLHRKMAENLLETQRFVAIGHMRAKNAGAGSGAAQSSNASGSSGDLKTQGKQQLHAILGLGQLMSVHITDDDAHLTVMGLQRVRVKAFAQQSIYPIAEIERLPDVFGETSPHFIDALEQDLINSAEDLFHLRENAGIPKNETLPPDYLDHLLDDDISLGQLCDGLGAFFSFDTAEKQMLLDEIDAVKRAEKLLFLLRFQTQSFYSGHNPYQSLS